MIQVTSREFRDRQATLLSAADDGEYVVIHRRGKPSYTLVRVFNEDILLSPELLQRIEGVKREIERGEYTDCRTEEEIDAYLDSLCHTQSESRKPSKSKSRNHDTGLASQSL
jgi:antitoxin (DNA-binding transcriptional repressor) of toxin-antitoxin stability system